MSSAGTGSFSKKKPNGAMLRAYSIRSAECVCVCVCVCTHVRVRRDYTATR